ncbi:MAG: hypothetical protein PHW95_00085 [Patescibacteria group bacterium]|nr:hypothetical protein [Patescibacteria group bacterium]
MSVGRNSVDRFIPGVDLPTGRALDECRRAVLEIMMVWPDQEISPEAIFARASGFLHTDGRDGELARHTLESLIAQCRNYPTITRGQTFWTIVKSLFKPYEALVLYLGQCSSLSLNRERRAVVSHLRAVGYTLSDIKQADIEARLGMNDDDFVARLRQCLGAILGMLPDVETQRNGLEGLVAASYNFGGRFEEANGIIGELMSVIPIHFGVFRQPLFWDILRVYFTDEEAVSLYLIRFPNAATRKQIACIRCYLVETVGFNPELVDDLIKDRDFQLVPNQVSRPNKKSRRTF